MALMTILNISSDLEISNDDLIKQVRSHWPKYTSADIEVIHEPLYISTDAHIMPTVQTFLNQHVKRKYHLMIDRCRDESLPICVIMPSHPVAPLYILSIIQLEWKLTVEIVRIEQHDLPQMRYEVVEIISSPFDADQIEYQPIANYGMGCML